MNKRKNINNNGITLIALVVTIVVLLILAGISLNLVLGNNGIIMKTKDAKFETEKAKILENLRLDIYQKQVDDIDSAIGGLEYLKSLGKVDDDKIVQIDNIDKGISTGKGDMSNGDVYYIDNGDLFYKDSDNNTTEIGKIYEDKEGTYDKNGIYSVPDVIEKVAPTELFDYERNGQTSMKIRRIKPQYCNAYGYNPDTRKWNDYENTNYEIKYNGTTISDTLIIPYQVKIDGEVYTITEVDISVCASDHGGLPAVKTIIYPNTVKIIDNQYNSLGSRYYNSTIQKIILPDKLERLGSYAFAMCPNFESIEIPDSVTSIGFGAFEGCQNLTNIEIPESVKSIEGEAFGWCEKLVNIKIPDSVTSIGNYAFWQCTSLTNITIPKNVTSIGNSTFYGCNSLTTINIKKSTNSITGAPWSASKATINWNYTGE